MQRSTYSTRACVGKSLPLATVENKSGHNSNVIENSFTIYFAPQASLSCDVVRSILAEHWQSVSLDQ
jgi:hypothetical protein